MTEPLPTHLSVPAVDGFPLAASYVRRGDAPAAVVLVVPATAVRRRLYEPFAAFLADQGYATVAWDWRGTGDSRPASLRGFRATMRDWAEQDLEGVIAWAARRHPDVPLVAVGHSFGGQAVGLAPGAARLAAVVTVAAQSGYWGHWPAPQRYGYAALWHVLVPLLSRAAGYFPARSLGLGEDLPEGVARQWAAWCRNPSYHGDWAGYRRLRAPVLGFSFEDDPYAPRASVDALHRELGTRALRRRHVKPSEVGVRSIGHFGFFRRGHVPSLWQELGGWLRATLAPVARSR